MQQVIYRDSYFHQKLSLHLHVPMQESWMGLSRCACCKHLPLLSTEKSTSQCRSQHCSWTLLGESIAILFTNCFKKGKGEKRRGSKPRVLWLAFCFKVSQRAACQEKQSPAQRAARSSGYSRRARRETAASGRGKGKGKKARSEPTLPATTRLCRSATRHPFCCLPSAGLKSVGSFIQAGQAGPGLAGELREGMGKWERAEPRATSGGEHTRVSTNLVTVPTGL